MATLNKYASTEEIIEEATYKMLKSLADAGCLFAQYNIGLYYMRKAEKEVISRDRNYRRAIRYMQASAKNGYRSAFFMLEKIFARGLGVVKNARKAAEYKRMGDLHNLLYSTPSGDK